MSLSAYTTAVQTRARGRTIVWFEIEGIPWAYGTHAKDSSWFASRDPGDQFAGIRAWLSADHLPDLPEQVLDVEGGTITGGALELHINDVDGAFAETVGAESVVSWLRLTTGGVSSADTTFAFSGDSSSWTNGQTFYVDGETCEAGTVGGASLTSVTRGLYRSLAVAHAGPTGNDDPRPTEGSILSTTPRRFEGRRVWVYAGHAASAETDCVCVWTGRIEELAFVNGGREAVLSCSQAYGELNQRVFSDLGTFGTNESESTKPHQWLIDHYEVASSNQYQRLETETVVFGAEPAWNVTGATNRRAFIADGWQPLQLSGDFSTETSLDVTRLPSFATWKYLKRHEEVNQGGWDHSYIQECAAILDGSPHFTAGQHPLDVFLQIALSTPGNVTSSDYDTLPDGWGLGMTEASFDMAGFRAMRRATAYMRLSFVVVEPIDDFGEWAHETLLKPFGFYLKPSLGNEISVGRLTTHLESDLTYATNLTSDDIVDAQAVEWHRDVSEIVGRIVWQDDLQPTPDGWKLVGPPVTINLSSYGIPILTQWPKARTIEVKSSGTRAVGDVPLGERLPGELAQAYAIRYGGPSATVKVTCTFKHILRELGELVTLTLATVPVGGIRGGYGVYEVVGKRVSFQKATVELTLRQVPTSAYVGGRGYAPAAVVKTLGTPLAMEANIYTPTELGLDADLSAFAAGDLVRVYAPKLTGRTSVREILSISGNDLTLDDHTGISVGDVVMHADAADQSDWNTVRNKYAFRGTADAVLYDADENENDAPIHG